MKHHLVFLDRASLGVDFPRPDFPHDYTEYPETMTESEVIARLAPATIVLNNKVKITEAILSQLPNLKMIAIAATGSDIIDKAACAKRGIIVSNIQNYAINTVPEHTLALIFALRRNLVTYANSVRKGRWFEVNQFCYFDYKILDVAGSTLGIVGYGSLGKSIAKRAEALGLNIIATDTYDFPGRVDLDTLFRQADIITLHCPLTPENKHMINAKTLGMMKKTAILINTARGGLVDSQALVAALKSGQIGGAGIDVLADEPPRPGSDPLLDYTGDNLIVTPHVAWASHQAMTILAQQLSDNIAAFVAGKPRNIVS
ncbi:MAG: D-2-hydroxyacid dehydrogenase [Alphaproteobacteria bacterium]|nr:D-2-hydroxyacid dehydrogenase [Alphaproteobacteria bacterium]